MTPDPRMSTAARISVAALGGLSFVGGWLILVHGGFYHSPPRRSVDAVFVGGLPALFMVLLQFVIAGLAFTALLERTRPRGAALAIAFGLVMIPPALYLAVR